MGPTLGGLCLEVGIEALHEMEETLPLHGSLYGLSYRFTELENSEVRRYQAHAFYQNQNPISSFL